ncbi:peptidyl-prolyl cis-trans isomerase-like 3 isoform X3 [Dermacentor andersoni]|uniref:peptidyl-prolyl cis-trans isomerase-like 3 isoform X3 n=1 Tax=Dermacentor andersoni TaxID=34620 RepID=UPI003B3BDB6B
MSVTLHTDLGDIKIELFCETCPKAAENFLALCASDYYNGCLFHRNIKGFMVQTGDPTDVALKKQGDICLSSSFGVVLYVASDKGTGKGGESIWGAKFADEIRDELKCTRCCLHGKQWAQYEWVTVFHHICQAAAPGPQVHHLWKGH